MELKPFKMPHTPQTYFLLEALGARKDLPPHDEHNLTKLRRGYLGEQKFFQKIKALLPKKTLAMYSLNLSSNEQAFQLDSLLFFQQKIFHFEIKYFAGDYVLRDGNWFALESNLEITSPLIQLHRSNRLLSQLVRELDWSGDVVSQVVFMHENFTLYGARPEQPLIFLSQLEQRIRRIVANEGVALAEDYHLARKLAERHIVVSKYERPPSYHYDDLWKGIVCDACYGKMQRASERLFVCGNCGKMLDNASALKFNVKHLLLLFPDSPLTVASIYDWCGGEIPKRTIRNHFDAYAFRHPSKRKVTFSLPKELTQFTPFF